MRKKVIAGNWKMNIMPSETAGLVSDIRGKINNAGCKAVICVPFVDLTAALEAVKGSDISVGAQNCHWERSGAFTGEISAAMLRDIGVEYVIIGHSERRQYFGETDQMVNKRVLTALEAGLKVIVCVGETLEQRETGITDELVALQTKTALGGVSLEQMENIIIAYEPVWAIGTGRTATAAQADEVCSHIRATVRSLYGSKTADSVIIQYGGSMNASNASELLAMPNIDGGLIGGASLKPDDFGAIIKIASEQI